MPGYIERRIRRPIPPWCVVPGSTPVVALGNARTATVATLGINPTRAEFIDRDGNELVGADRWLATHTSLEISDLSGAPESAIEQVLNDCNEYFQRNPGWQRFKHLEQVLNGIGASYCDGSACHLNLVQWATDPVWNRLPASEKRALINGDAYFLQGQLRSENISLLLVNGNAVIEQLREKYINADFPEFDRIEGIGRHPVRLFARRLPDGIQLIAWSINLQSSVGVSSELREELAKRVERICSSSGAEFHRG